MSIKYTRELIRKAIREQEGENRGATEERRQVGALQTYTVNWSPDQFDFGQPDEGGYPVNEQGANGQNGSGCSPGYSSYPNCCGTPTASTVWDFNNPCNLGCQDPAAVNYNPNATQGCCPVGHSWCGPFNYNYCNHPTDCWEIHWCCDYGPQDLHTYVWPIDVMYGEVGHSAAWYGLGTNYCGNLNSPNLGPFYTFQHPQYHTWNSTFLSANNTWSSWINNCPAGANNANGTVHNQSIGNPSPNEFAGFCHVDWGSGLTPDAADNGMLYLGITTVSWPYVGTFTAWVGEVGSQIPTAANLMQTYSDCSQTSLDVEAYAHCPGPAPYSIPGCTDSNANNYDPNATVDDGSCSYDPVDSNIYGCTDPTALNYDSNATVNDGSCIAAVYGCLDPTAINYYPGVTPSTGCGGGPNDWSCCYYEGCNDPTANNYDSNHYGCNQDPNDTSCCTYDSIDPVIEPCDEANWLDHINNNYSSISSDPDPTIHFCEWCNNGTITDSLCKCCPPVDTEKPDCCDWCLTAGQGSIPPAGCEDFNCDDCPGWIPESFKSRFKKLANIKK